MPNEPSPPDSTLTALFSSRAMARLVIFFAVRPGQRFHLRELIRRTGLSSASVQREVNRLVDADVLVRAEENGRVQLTANDSHDAWRAWTLLLRSAAAPADVLREALSGTRGIDGAFLYGSAVRGDARPDSDIDLFLIVNDGHSNEERRQLSEAELLIGRPLDIVEYTVATARERLRFGNPFVNRVMAGPKMWLFGDRNAFAAEAA